MEDHAEEQAMEAEALAAIFDTHFEVHDESCAGKEAKWSIEIYPETGDPSELDEINHVACKLAATLPLDYPENLPTLHVEIIKGLTEAEHIPLLENIAAEEAEANQGVPSIFAIAERIREWLAENNVKGLDDRSMHAQMMRKQQQAEHQQRIQNAFEAQKQQEEFTEAELEELAVRKQREEGAPCNSANFLAWKEQFDTEMAEKALEDEQKEEKTSKKKDKSVKASEDKAGRMTGYQYFISKASNLEALEAAAEEAEKDEIPAEDLEDVDEGLFEEDVDLDELDFESDQEDEELDI